MEDITALRDVDQTHVKTLALEKEVQQSQIAEEAMRESEEKWRLLYGSFPGGSFIVNDKYIIENVNDFFCAVTGFAKEELVGQFCGIICPEGPHKCPIFDIGKERIDNDETAVKTKDGRLVPIIKSARRIPVGKREVIVENFYDITQRKRAEEALKRRLEQLTSLSRASQAVTASLELDQVLAEIVSLAREVAASDCAGVVLVDKEGRLGWSVECPPAMPGIARRIRAEGFTHWIVCSRQVVVVDDIDEDGLISPRPSNGQAPDGSTGSPQRLVEGPPCTVNPPLVEAGVKSFVGLPLLAQDRLLGILYLHSLRPGNFRDQLSLLTTFANQAAVAIENARLYQIEQKRAAQLSMVNQVARQTASILDLDQLLQEAVTAVQQRFNYHHVGLFLLDKVAGELEMQAIAGGFADMAPPDHRLALREGMVGWAAETGQTLLANDVSQEPRYVLGVLKEALTQSELCVPLKLADKVIGVLDIQCTRLNAFDETDVLAMETLADQMAVAIENARLFRETKRHFEETTALYQTSLDITAQLEMSELLNSIVERAVTLLRAEAGSIYLYNPEGDELRHAIGYGYTEKYVGLALKLGEGMAGTVFQSGEPLIVDDYRTWEGRAPVYEADQPFTAVLEVPLRWQDRIIGVLAIDADVQQRTFNQDDIWLATLFANQAAVAIENARIYQEERKRVTQLELIGGFTRKIASILDLDELLPQVAHLIGDTFGYYYTSILLVEASSDELVMRAGTGPFIEALVDRLRLKIGREGITGWVARSGEPLLVNDVSREPRYYFLEEINDTRSELAVPIKLKGEIIGVLDVQSVEFDAFGQDDIFILQTLADQLAVAIENARLYQETVQRLKEAETLGAVTTALTRSLDLDRVLQSIVDSATRLIPASTSGVIHLVDEAAGRLIPRATSPEVNIQKSMEMPIGKGIAGLVMQEKRLINVPDVEADSRFLQLGTGTPKKSLLTAPLMIDGDCSGTLSLNSDQVEAFSADDERLLTTLAAQATIAVKNAWLHQEVQRRVEELVFLNRVGRAITSSLELEQILATVMEETISVLGTEAGSISLLDEESSELVFAAVVGPRAEKMKGIRLPLGRGIAGWVAREGQRLLVPDVRGDPRFYPGVDEVTGFVTKSILAAPLKVKGKMIGVIEAVNKTESDFSQADVALLSSIAQTAAIAIENARLYEELQNRVEELKRAQAQLIQSAKLAAIGELAAGVAHEINNPLTSIIGFTRLLLRGVDDGAIKEDLQIIDREAARTKAIVKGLLDFAHQREPRLEPADVNEIVRTIITLIHHQAKGARVTIRESCDKTLPSVLLDADQIKQVFLNIMTNAIQAMPEGGELKVVTAYRPQAMNGADCVAIEFHDTGTGISAEDFPHIFDPFFTTKEAGQGTGLGLSISRSIVDGHGGWIEVESKVGWGSIFTVLLPVTKGQKAAP